MDPGVGGEKKMKDERYTMIFEDPAEEDRESLPVKKPPRNRMKPTVA